MPTSHWDVAEVCLNGHVTNDIAGSAPELDEDHCSKCGEETISQCPACQESIRGYLHRQGTYRAHVKPRNAQPSPFCHRCGKPYPWTERALQAARDLVRELVELSEEEKAQLEGTLPDIVRETPRTTLATSRFKRLVAKAGAEAGSAFKTILIGVASEGAKRAIWG